MISSLGPTRRFIAPKLKDATRCEADESVSEVRDRVSRRREVLHA
jgi:hypothetical protein